MRQAWDALARRAFGARAELPAIIAVCLVAIGLRFAWAAWSSAEPNFENDGGLYHFLARSLSRGDGYSGPFGDSTMYLSPGYPAALAAALWPSGESLLAAKAMNAVMGGLSVVPLYAIARMAMRPTLSLLAAILVVLMPSQIQAAAVMFPDGLLILLVLAGVWCYLRALGNGEPWRWAFASGLLLGAGVLTQPQLAPFPLALAAYALVADRDARRRRMRIAAAVLAGTVLVVAPWCVRNAVVFGDPSITSNGGVAFWIGHHEGATGHREVATRLEGSSERARNYEGYRSGLAFTATHPWTEAAAIPKRLYWMLGDDEEWMELNEAHGVQTFLTMDERDYWFTLANAYYYALLTAGVLGLLISWPLRQPALAVPALFGACWIAVHLLFFGDPRFHAALMPVMALFAARFVGALWEVVRSTPPVQGSGMPL